MNREKNLLKMMVRFESLRYLMSNADGRWDGAEKATRHINLSDAFVAWWFGLPSVSHGGRFNVNSGKYKDSFNSISTTVRNATRPLTDHLDEVIGFPLEGRPNYDDLMPKFFDHFYDLAVEKLQEITDSLDEDEREKYYQ